MRVGVLTKAELAAGHDPLGAGRRGRGARRGPRLHRPAPGRHAGGRGRTCATSTPCGCWSTKGPAGSTSSSRSAPPSTATPTAELELAREGGHSAAPHRPRRGAATGAEIERALVDAVRAEAAAVYESSFALDLIVEGGRCRGVAAADRRRRTSRCGPSTCSGHGRRRPALRRHHQPDRGHRRRRGHGAAGGGGPGRRRVRAVPPDRAAPPRDAAAAADRGAARATARCCGTSDGERFVDELLPRDKVEPGHHGPDDSSRASTTSGSTPPGLDSFDERFPTIAAELDGRRASTRRRTGCPSPRRPTTRCGGIVDRPRRRLVAARACGWPARRAATG